MKKLSFGRSLLFLFLIFASFSCVYENRTTPENEEEREITIQIAIPGVQSSTLRAMDGAKENMIRTVDVLVFHVGEDGNDYYDYYARVRKSNNNTEGAETQLLDVILRTKTSQRLVVITNARAEVSALLGIDSWKNSGKNAMLSQLVSTMANVGDQWNTSTDYTALPMWGESDKIDITSTTSSLNTSIPLLRMVAKVNVQLDKSKVNPDQFKLKSVRLYNTNTMGRIVPNPSAVASGSGIDRLYVTAPSIPAGAQNYHGPLVYSGNEAFASPGELDVAMKGAIYTFETAVPTNLNRLNVTGLVIGGMYKNDAKITYYRVDFLNNDKSFRNILRNHNYEIKIVAVDGPGYDTPEEAWENYGENMEVTILEWDDPGMEHIVFDGQYFLSVSRNQFFFSMDARENKESDNTLVVKTDYPKGWKVIGISSHTTGMTADWLTFKNNNGTNYTATGDTHPNGTECWFTYTKNTSGKERSVEILLAAGRLQYPVVVTQDTLQRAKITFKYDAERIEITNDTLVFVQKNPGEDARRDLYIAWEPKNSDMIVFEMPLSSSIPWLRADVPAGLKFLKNGTFSPAGEYSYLIGVSKDHVRGAATSFVFQVSNGKHSTERKLILYYP